MQSKSVESKSVEAIREVKLLTVVIIVPVWLLDGVTVRHRVRGRGRGEIGRYTADGHSLAMSVHRIWVEGGEFGMLWDG